MEANNNIYLRNSLDKDALTEIASYEVSTKKTENPTVFGESDSQILSKQVSRIPQSSFTRVEQWINDWKQGMMKIEAGIY